MRTPDEIAAWLRERPWYGQFVKNMLGDGFCTDAASGRYGMDTVSRAFIWHHTPEGFGCWQRRSQELQEFLLGDAVEGHI